MGTYKVSLKRSVLKDLSKISKKDVKRIMNIIHSLSMNPRPPGVKKLSGQEKYRIRQGNYRILYFIKDKNLIVCVVKVGHRKNVYD